MTPSVTLCVKEITDRIDVVGQGMNGPEYREFLRELLKSVDKRFTIHSPKKERQDAGGQSQAG